MGKKLQQIQDEKVTPIFGRDEMNLVEIPFGPVTPTKSKTLEVVNVVRDRKTQREVERRFLITGSDAFGLPKPVDDQVLIGLKTLTAEAGMTSPRVAFSRHELCRVLGWRPDGRAYKRIEESLDRIAGTTLKFKDAWWDKGEQEWRSHTFHLISNVELCSKERYEKIRAKTKQTRQALCSFVWNDVVWKSLEDGFIRKVDMEMFRRIANGPRREVPVRLFRILGKRLWKKQAVSLRLEKLCVAMLGLQTKYPSRMRSTLERAAKVLIDVGFIGGMKFRKDTVTFIKRTGTRVHQENNAPNRDNFQAASELEKWLDAQDADELVAAEQAALAQDFGSRLEREHVKSHQGEELSSSMKIRLLYIRRFMSESAPGGRGS